MFPATSSASCLQQQQRRLELVGKQKQQRQHQQEKQRKGASVAGEQNRQRSDAVGTPQAAVVVVATESKRTPLRCDACDKLGHSAATCPIFKGKARDKHPDAKQGAPKGIGVPGRRLLLPAGSARVVSQPPDGSCLFHSLCYGLRAVGKNCGGGGAGKLRAECARFVLQNPGKKIAGTPLASWIK